ncbi:MAG: NAD(P)/FAD-dependent oxidoreductase [Acidiphilium sp.]|nr:NAD(P)/FAD-dependent oxidoreductase [Acidiphilium sp.]MDD4936292.1 NAD(P)/FAD-dependent oxidoreductase [Acidiphilium sp.]
MNHLATVAEHPALDILAAQVRHDLECLDYPARAWVRPRQHASASHVFDVAIVGAGQSGLATAFGLLRERIDNIVVLDENPEGLEGPWLTYARMATLRTPKHITSIDGGVPSLTFRVWWEAQHGAAGWEALGKIPRQEWMRYLRWYRRTLALPVRNDTRVSLIEPVEAGLFRLHLEAAGAPEPGALLARKVVLATGIQGGGEWHTPDFIRAALPRARYAHTSEAIDYSAMQGRRIGILGGGASAFDNAQFALGAGVGEAHVFMRRAEMPRVNPIRFMENAGFLGHFADLDDAVKYRAIDHFLRQNQPPTNDMFSRAAGYPGFHLHLGAPWTAVAETRAGVRVETPQGAHEFDFVVLSTGMLTDARLRPELALVAEHIACWRDRFAPADGKRNALLDDHPYLGPNFGFVARSDAGVDKLHGLFAFNYAALASLGLSASALSGLKFALPKLVQGIAGQLFTDDAAATMRDYMAYAEQEFIGQWPAA